MRGTLGGDCEDIMYDSGEQYINSRHFVMARKWSTELRQDLLNLWTPQALAASSSCKDEALLDAASGRTQIAKFLGSSS